MLTQNGINRCPVVQEHSLRPQAKAGMSGSYREASRHNTQIPTDVLMLLISSGNLCAVGLALWCHNSDSEAVSDKWSAMAVR